jgi:hypothetical protein
VKRGVEGGDREGQWREEQRRWQTVEMADSRDERVSVYSEMVQDPSGRNESQCGGK